MEKPRISLDSDEIFLNLMTEILREGEPCMQEHLYEDLHGHK